MNTNRQCESVHTGHRVQCTRELGHRGRHEYRTRLGELVHQWNNKRKGA